MTSRTCLIHNPKAFSTYVPLPYTHYPMLHIAHSAWSRPPPFTDRAKCNALHSGAAWSHTRLPRKGLFSNRRSNAVNIPKSANRINACSALSVNMVYSSVINPGCPKNREEERLKRFLEGIIQGVRQIQDALRAANYIAVILRSKLGSGELPGFVEATVLNTCHRLFREIICYCATEASSRLQPVMTLLGHLVKLRVIPAEPAFALTEALLREVDQPYRIEGVFTLLVDPASGILTDKDHIVQADRILREMGMRNLRYLRENKAMGRHQ